MASIIFTGDNSGKRIENSITRALNAADGYRIYIDGTTATTIANVVAAAGVITLPQVYVPGRYNLQVVVNGLIRCNVGVSLATNDYVELNNRQIQLGTSILAMLTAAPLTSNIEIRWNRHWPGVRDALLVDLQNVDQNMSDAILDTGTLRASPATAANPLATMADLPGPNILGVYPNALGATGPGSTPLAAYVWPVGTAYLIVLIASHVVVIGDAYHYDGFHVINAATGIISGSASYGNNGGVPPPGGLVTAGPAGAGVPLTAVNTITAFSTGTRTINANLTHAGITASSNITIIAIG